MSGERETWRRPSAWYGAITFFLSLYLANGDSGFSFLAFVICWGFFWLLGLPFRFFGWINLQLTSRPCPVCGLPVRNGKTSCDSCGTDFRLR